MTRRSQPGSSPRKLVLFDLYDDGHHGQYVDQLASAWLEFGLPAAAELHMVLPPSFPRRRPDVHERLMAADARITVHLFDEGVSVRTAVGARNLLHNDLLHGRLAASYCRQLRPDQLTFLYMDHAQVSLATRLRRLRNVDLSGIYFRPSLHYASLEGTTPVRSLNEWRKRLTLRAALANPRLKHVFSLDPYVSTHLESKAAAKFVTLPDGVPITEGAKDWALRSEMPKDRVVITLFGALDSRKGLFVLLEALTKMDPAEARKFALVLAGRVYAPEAEALQSKLQLLQDRGVPAVRDARFVPDEELADLIMATDLVAVPYQRHVGSSNVLVRAAQAGKPVLGPDYGMLGEHIRRNRLGYAVDTTRAEAVADALRNFVRGAGPDFSAENAARFADANSARRMAETFYRTLGFPVPDAST